MQASPQRGQALVVGLFWLFGLALLFAPFLREPQAPSYGAEDFTRAEEDYVFDEDVAAFDEEFDLGLAEALGEASERWFGEDSPELAASGLIEVARLENGREAYELHCVGCHNFNGDGGGPAATHLAPRPRNFRKGIFKFTSTDTGRRPLREDLHRTITRGLIGSSMPDFRLLSEELRWNLVEYVRWISMRGEFEQFALDMAWEDEEVPDLDELAELVRRRWSPERNKAVFPGAPETPFDQASIDRGRALYLDTASANCVACHGPGGKGDGVTADDYTDDWGYPIRPRDFTLGTFRVGSDAIDLYRSIATGIQGTPMAAFAGAMSAEEIWDVVHFVQYLANPDLLD